MTKLRLPYQVPARAKAILLALMRALIVEPDELTIPDKEDALIERCRLLLAEFPRFTRFCFLFSLYAFDWLTLFFGFGFLRFVHLRAESQRRYVHKWMHSRWSTLAESFKAIRGMVMVAYFSHPAVWSYIGYNPKAHVAERIQLRKDLLKNEKVS